MKQEKNTPDITSAISAGFNLLSSEDVTVPAKELENLATFKVILMRLLQGELVLATPDRLKDPEKDDAKD